MSKNSEPKLESITADVSAQRIARVYAEALVDTAEERGQGDAVFDELNSLIEDVFAADPQFEAFLASAAGGRDGTGQALRTIVDNPAGEVSFNFLLGLNDPVALGLRRLIRDAARQIRDQRARRIRVQVRSAVHLQDDQRQRLE